MVACDGQVSDLAELSSPSTDAHVDLEDAHVMIIDAGSPPDAGIVQPIVDAGTQPPVDSGIERDAGSPPAIDAGTPPPVDAGTLVIDAGTPPFDAGTSIVSMLIAQGRLGRTIVSCDDGQTWRNNRDEVPGAQCGDPPNIECDHHPWASQGIVQTEDAVVANWGWGAPGTVRRTVDGVTWQNVLTVQAGANISGLAAVGNRVMTGAGLPMLSSASGAANTWATVTYLGGGNVTRHIASAGNRFVVLFDSSLRVSDDNGSTWRTPTTPSGCVGPVLGIVAHDQTIVFFHYGGSVCVSRDLGDRWTVVPVASAFSSKGVWAQGYFTSWNGSTRYRSADGLTWSQDTGSPADVSIGAVVYTPAGTYVAFKGGWRSSYADERIYRSRDGLAWETLPSTAHVHSHPITHLLSASVRASSICP